MSIRIILKNGSAIEVEDMLFSNVKKIFEITDVGKTSTLCLSNKVILFTDNISHILNTGSKKEITHIKPFYEGCDNRCVQYEGDGVTVSLIYCNHPENLDNHEGNCRVEICPLDLKEVTS